MIVDIEKDIEKLENVSYTEEEVQSIYLKQEDKYYKAYITEEESLTCDDCALFEEFGRDCPAYCIKINKDIEDIKFKSVKNYEALFGSVTHAL